jgi:hypothetical protein
MKKLLMAVTLSLCFGLVQAAGGPGPESTGTIAGKVLEAKDVDSYTYLRLQTVNGEVWAAVAKVPVKLGDAVTIEDAALMQDFTSKAMGRTFDQIYFGIVGEKATEAAGAGMDMAAMHASVARSTDVADVNVARATGPVAHTVAEIVAGRADLNDTTVVVRGKVVKFTPDVLGKNWIHLRDGSGSASDGTNDVLVTTTNMAGIGDVVLVKGAVRTDRDLGSGYAYKVLIEDATLQK